MPIDLPIVCSLEGQAFEARTSDWERALADVAGRDQIPGGVELHFDEGELRAQLHALIDSEAECCPWMSMRIVERDRGLSLSISSDDPMGEQQINQWFGIDVPTRDALHS